MEFVGIVMLYYNVLNIVGLRYDHQNDVNY